MAEVTCKYCKQKFDRTKEKFIQYKTGGTRRYAHPTCEPDKSLPVYERVCHICQDAGMKDEFINLPGSKQLWVHPQCLEKYKPNDRELLEWYILGLFNIDTLTGPIRRNIKIYHDDYKWSYTAIRHTLEWWFDIEKNDVDKANGNINIVPYVIERAKKYWQTKHQADEANKDIEVKPMENVKVAIKAPKRERFRSNSFSFLDEEE